jgi:hypothetical protein
LRHTRNMGNPRRPTETKPGDGTGQHLTLRGQESLDSLRARPPRQHPAKRRVHAYKDRFAAEEGGGSSVTVHRGHTHGHRLPMSTRIRPEEDATLPARKHGWPGISGLCRTCPHDPDGSSKSHSGHAEEAVPIRPRRHQKSEICARARPSDATRRTPSADRRAFVCGRSKRLLVVTSR